MQGPHHEAKKSTNHTSAIGLFNTSDSKLSIVNSTTANYYRKEISKIIIFCDFKLKRHFRDTWRTKNVFNKSGDITADKLTSIGMWSRIIIKDHSWIRAYIVRGTEIAIYGAIQRTKFDYATNHTAGLKLKYTVKKFQ